MFAAIESLGGKTGPNISDEQLFDVLGELDKVQVAYDRYLIKLIEKDELLVAYHQSANYIVGAYVSAITAKLNTFGVLPHLDSFLIERLQETNVRLSNAMGEAGGRADSALFKLRVANGAVTAVSLVTPIGAAVKIAATQAAIKGGTYAVIRAGVTEAVKQVAITGAVAGGMIYTLPYVVQKSGLEPHQLELGMAALEAFGVLRSLKYVKYSKVGSFQLYPGISSKSADDIAFGLWNHQESGNRNLLENFSRYVGAKTYGDVYGAGVAPTEKMLETMMYSGRYLHINLDGLVKNMDELPDIVRMGSRGMDYQPSFGVGNVTNWEIWRIHQDPELLKKAVFYLNGKVETP